MEDGRNELRAEGSKKGIKEGRPEGWRDKKTEKKKYR